MVLDASWRIVGPPRGNQVINTAIKDLQTFLERSMNVCLSVRQKPLNADVACRHKVIIVADAKALPETAEGLDGSESYRIRVEPQRILLCGADGRSAMQAVYYLEDLMGFAGGPYLKPDGRRNRFAKPRWFRDTVW